MKKYGKLKRYLPDTEKMSNEALTEFLEKYRDIILKPMGGKRGRGVVRITEVQEHQYQIHFETIKEFVEGQEKLISAARRYTGNRKYIVQRRVPLATVKGRPFDIRVVVQRPDHSRRWKVTGKAAKVAGEGYIVTNTERSGGSVLSLEKAIRKSRLRSSPKSLIRQIDKVAVRAAERLHKLFKEKHIFGFDMGLGDDGRVWIIEANLSPMLSHFKKLPSKKQYRRIRRYKRMV